MHITFWISGGKGPYKGNIEQFQISDASYTNAILSSTVSMAIEDNQLDLDLLTSEKIIQLRNKATITCNEEKNPDTDFSATMKTPALFNIINDPCENSVVFKYEIW
jgi:hypothetical protein